MISIVAVILTILPHNFHFIALKFHKPPQIPTDKKQFYAEYINSHQWRKIRQKRLEKDRFMCQNCNVVKRLLTRKQLEVHHKTYVRLGSEKQKDLITLCRRCHNKIHKGKH